MRAFRHLVLAAAAAGGVLLAPAAASAHGMTARVKVRADSVHVLAFFDDDSPAQSAAVRVTDAAGTEVAAGTTNERGEWTFPRPAPGRYALTAKCIGHAAKVDILVDGDPESPAFYSGRGLGKAAGLALGLTLLLGISAASWLRLRRRA
jgi:hypothetical protein